jgi:transposase-like protein
MARPRLSNEIRESIERLYYTDGLNISAVARKLAISRNSAKSVIRNIKNSRTLRAVIERRAEEHTPKGLTPENQVARSEILKAVDLEAIQQLFEEFRAEGDNRQFSRLQKLIENVAIELNIKSTTDMFRVEAALYHYMTYRRSHFKAMKVMSGLHGKNWVESFEKMSRASARLMDASVKASDKFLAILKELEVRAGVRLPDINKANIFVQSPK